MYNILDGAPPTENSLWNYELCKRRYSNTKMLSQTLQQQGTFFKEVNASVVGHYAGVNNFDIITCLRKD